MSETPGKQSETSGKLDGSLDKCVRLREQVEALKAQLELSKIDQELQNGRQVYDSKRYRERIFALQDELDWGSVGRRAGLVPCRTPRRDGQERLTSWNPLEIVNLGEKCNREVEAKAVSFHRTLQILV